MEKLLTSARDPSQLRLSLSGGHASKAWFQTLKELADTETPQIAIDSSALIGKDLFDSHRMDYIHAFERHGLPDPIWLQNTPDSLLHKTLVEDSIAASDVLLVFGGSTDELYKRWRRANVIDTVSTAVFSGSIVACGGSAGAMIWFDKGYSDSDQYICPPNTPWKYRVVKSVGLFDAWVTAHYSDKDESGLKRSKGFKKELQNNMGDWRMAIGIDSSASLVVFNGIATVKNINPIGYNDPANVYVHTPEREPTTLKPGMFLQLINQR